MSLRRRFGVLDVFCIASGAMISSGLFILPSIAFNTTGPSVVFAYFLAGLLMVPSMLTKIELATAMPRSGGTYFFIERSLGTLPGMFGGLANWLAISLKSAFALLGIGFFGGLMIQGISDVQVKAIAVTFCAIFTLVNIMSVRSTGRLQILLVLGLLLCLFWYVIGGISSVTPERFSPFLPSGWRSLFTATGMVFISYGGLTKVADVSEEIDNPTRAIPLGMVLAFITASLLYVAVVFVTTGVMDSSMLQNSRTPISDGAGQFGGEIGKVVMAIAGLLAFLTTANAGLLSASRSPLAMSRDDLLPHWFRRVNRRFGTPHVAILTTAAFMVTVIVFLQVESLVKTASTLMLILFVMENAAIIVLRESKIPTYRPVFRVPLYPWLPLGAITVYLFLIFEMGTVPLLITAAFAVTGLGWYVLYGRLRTKRQSALIHLVEHITAREISSSTLGTELQQVLRERDNIIEDRFDRLIQSCPILDIPKAVSLREFFDEVASVLARRLDLKPESVLEMLLAREMDSSTVVAPGLAIPHIIIEGKHKFDILVARCRAGVKFRESAEPVQLVFVLAGSRDERPFHLRTLMDIAQMVHHPRFEKQCLNVRNAEEIRNIILVSERQRGTKEQLES